MPCKRVIPLLLMKDGLLKKPLQFIRRPRTVANPISICSVFEGRRVDELILLDIGRREHGLGLNENVIQQICDLMTVPFVFGGNLDSFEDAANSIKAGAEKVSFNTGLLTKPSEVKQVSKVFGKQAVVASIDAKREENGRYRAYIKNGREMTSFDPASLAKMSEELGAGEILINSISADGTMRGYDIDLIKQVSNAVNVPVIAAGGAGTPQDCVEAVIKGQADAVAVGSMFHFRMVTPNDIKAAMQKAGIRVRP